MNFTTRIAAAALAAGSVLAPASASWAAPKWHTIWHNNYSAATASHTLWLDNNRYKLISARDPFRDGGPRYAEDNPRFNCFVDGNQRCGKGAHHTRYTITARQAKVWKANLGNADLCITYPGDPFHAIMCRDGRTYIKG